MSLQLGSFRKRMGAGALARRTRRAARRRAGIDTAKTFGLLTVDKHAYEHRYRGRFLHVFVNGKNVTRNCASADDRQGWAVLYQRDRRGHIRADCEGPITSLVVGTVAFQEGAPIVERHA
jgi:hypothetical protein